MWVRVNELPERYHRTIAKRILVSILFVVHLNSARKMSFARTFHRILSSTNTSIISRCYSLCSLFFARRRIVKRFSFRNGYVWALCALHTHLWRNDEKRFHFMIGQVCFARCPATGLYFKFIAQIVQRSFRDVHAAVAE